MQLEVGEWGLGMRRRSRSDPNPYRTSVDPWDLLPGRSDCENWRSHGQPGHECQF